MQIWTDTEPGGATPRSRARLKGPDVRSGWEIRADVHAGEPTIRLPGDGDQSALDPPDSLLEEPISTVTGRIAVDVSGMRSVVPTACRTLLTRACSRLRHRAPT